MTENSSQLQEIKDLIGSIAPDDKTGNRAPVRTISDWVSGAQKSCGAKLNHARVSLFFSHHGFAEKLKITDLNYDKYVKDNIEGTGKLNRLCQAANTDLRLYEMDTQVPTRDCLGGDSAMQTDEMVKAIAYGMMAVEPGLDLISATAFGHGSEASARALYYLHNDIACDDLTCARILKTLLKPNGGVKGFEALQRIGGYEIAALCGVVVAARLANVPVLLEGETGAAVLSILKQENSGVTDHCALTGWKDIPSDVPFFILPHTAPKEPGLAIASLIPFLKNQIILQG